MSIWSTNKKRSFFLSDSKCMLVVNPKILLLEPQKLQCESKKAASMHVSHNLECVQRTFLQNCLPLMLIEKVKLRLKMLKGTE